MARPERFELPTFWFVAVNSLLILRNLRAKRRATDPSNVPNVPKPKTRLKSRASGSHFAAAFWVGATNQTYSSI